MSACDVCEIEAGTPLVDPEVENRLAQKLSTHVPQLASVSILKKWAGLRTLTDDGRFIIGSDPRLHNFFWVAGLGGHGVTTSAAVGALAADLILGRHRPEEKIFSPSRFL